MRQPFYYQLLLPMLGLMGTILIGVSGLNAYLGARRVQGQIEMQLREITLTLERSSFPLTDAVLIQLRGLSGAEFVLTGESGRVVAASTDRAIAAQLSVYATSSFAPAPQQRIPWNGATYFYRPSRLTRRMSGDSAAMLHVLYPETAYRQAWSEAVYPPVTIGLVAALLVVFSTSVLAGRISRPITQLRQQVIRIAAGDFSPLPLPPRPDEVRDLAESINQMTSMLEQYQVEVRQTERLRTLAQIGGGLAHQMRNAATGCRMAIDFLAGELGLSDNQESLSVARRQLDLMERYLRRFLALGTTSRKLQLRPILLADLVEGLLPLVRPAAQHVGVEIQWQRPSTALSLNGDTEELEQMIINLLLNGIEAAASHAPTAAGCMVRVAIRETDSDWLALSVEDSGPGPSLELGQRLFEPFVTTKADGIGLGLAVAKQVVELHGGRIQWQRKPGRTCFQVELPRLSDGGMAGAGPEQSGLSCRVIPNAQGG